MRQGSRVSLNESFVPAEILDIKLRPWEGESPDEPPKNLRESVKVNPFKSRNLASLRLSKQMASKF